MKIRGDFVTNSSSASYILAMSETFYNEVYLEESGMDPFIKYYMDKIKNEGNKIIIDDEEVYLLKLDFNTQDGITLDGTEYEVSNSELDFVMHTYDVNDLDDETLLKFLYNIVITRPNLLYGIGLTVVYHN
ncbi:hypothetical protein [Methanobacterium spitsbergense]|uniref:Uncharacterized protein n=1 Tax=Methanobacterium spitsbergense TaxID=2874285 RepID=A0A8T5ULB4_9EURY|nr:hypothetical protein [Methanobacterium spitsbergense]MBZ2164474.1 hypothetical protein [Methanobacterium spitsbergense]